MSLSVEHMRDAVSSRVRAVLREDGAAREGAADKIKATLKRDFLECEKSLIKALEGFSGLEFDGLGLRV